MTRLQATEWGSWILLNFADPAFRSGGLTFAISRLGGWAIGSATAVLGLVVVGLTALYFAHDPDPYVRVFLSLVPADRRTAVRANLVRVVDQLRWWLVAQLICMLTVGCLIAVGLALLRVPLWGTLAILSALLTFVPNAGPILSAIPAVLLAFADEPVKALWTLLLFAGVHFVEGNLVMPLVESRVMKVPPGLTLIAQLFLGATTGAVGVAVAAPLVVAIWGGTLARTASARREPNPVPEAVLARRAELN